LPHCSMCNAAHMLQHMQQPMRHSAANEDTRRYSRAPEAAKACSSLIWERSGASGARVIQDAPGAQPSSVPEE
jgi:hypothetical protein